MIAGTNSGKSDRAWIIAGISICILQALLISGLLANGWLYEDHRRFYLGPAVYGLTLASGHIRAGLVTHSDLAALNHNATAITMTRGRSAARRENPKPMTMRPMPKIGRAHV